MRPEQELAESVTRREPGRGYVIDKHGQEYIAHVEGCDCLADDSLHGAADHPVAALRRLLALRAEVHGA